MTELTRAELLRVIEEFKSERDAAKRDTLRAFEERDLALDQLALRNKKNLWQHAEGNVYDVITDDCAVHTADDTWDQPYVLYRSTRPENGQLSPRYYARPKASFVARFTKVE